MRLAALLLALCAAGVGAQDYPSKPIRLILPQSPGSATDVLVRLISPKIAEALGQPLVIHNRAGARSIVGAETAAKSPPDGYTVLVGASAFIPVSPHNHKKL